MPDDAPTFTGRIVGDIASVAQADWDACAGPDNPFVSHAFLSALEDSGSVGDRTGWWPQHLVLNDGAGRMVGAMPLYLKGNSYGEYMFDHSWAHAYEQSGGRYYPKLQCAVPFTPVPGPRLLVGTEQGPQADRAAAGLIEAAITFAGRMEVSSLHITFPDRTDWQRLGAAGLVQRIGQQFHWHNRGYRTFDEFLAALVSRKRKSIRKERRVLAENGITVRALTGSEISDDDWDAFYRFYVDTYDRKWGAPYLTREFFETITARLSDRVVLVMAWRDGRRIAGALNFRGADALFGRNWGCEEDHDFLHFECCYYQAIEYAIAHGLARVEAGTQGPHKVQRGYLPARTYSAHWFNNDAFAQAVADFTRREQGAIEDEMGFVTAHHSPYRSC